MNRIDADWAPTSGARGFLSAFAAPGFLRQSVLGYAIAPIAMALAFAVYALTPVLHDNSPYLFFVPAVLIAAGLGGIGPGLLATALGVVLGLLLIKSHSAITLPEVVNAVA